MTEINREGTTIALVNNKGGVGKTTTAVNLAACLADDGHRVLLVDLDAQSSASLSLGLTRANLFPGSAEAILDGVQPRDAIRASRISGLSIMPGSMSLASADIYLADVENRELVLHSALKQLRSEYDFIVLDCPPSLGLLTVNALTSADFFLVPVTPDYLGFEGLLNLMDAVDRIKAGIGKAGSFLGIVLTMADYRQNVTKEIGGAIRQKYGHLVFLTEIKVNVRLKEAPSFGKAINEYDKGCSGAKAYREFTKEALKRIDQGDFQLRRRYPEVRSNP
ncbi:MAG: ParA family protein [Thermovirgaceae bacterium]|nr:ParA family protein [Thermovirgaceae bacterium]